MVVVGSLWGLLYEPLVVAARSLRCFPQELSLVRATYITDTPALRRAIRGLPPEKHIVSDPPAGQEVVVFWNDESAAVVAPTDLPGVERLGSRFKYNDVTEVVSKRAVLSGVVASHSP